MNQHFSKSGLLMALITTSVLVTSLPLSIPEAVALSPAFVGAWHSGCGSSNITISNPSCPALTIGSIVTVDINVTDVSQFNAYELVLYFDPLILTPVSIDETDTVLCTPTTQGCTFHQKEDLGTGQLGAVRLTVVKLGGSFAGGSGVLVRVNFRIERVGVSPLALAQGMKHPSNFALGPTALTPNWTLLTLGSDPIDSVTSDGYFTNDPANLGPRAEFSTIPPSPQLGDRIILDASGSFDPDNNVLVDRGIETYLWDFGNGFATTTEFPVIAHTYVTGTGVNYSGNFSVLLTVKDSDDNFVGMRTRRVEVGTNAPPTVGFRIAAVPNQLILEPGSSAGVTIGLLSVGGFTGRVSLTATAVPAITNGPTARFGPSLVDLQPGELETSSLTIIAQQTTPPGRYVVIVTGSSVEMSQSTLIFVKVRPQEPVFAQRGISWTHHVSLTADNGTQRWISKVRNPNPISVEIHVSIIGEREGSSFHADSGPIIVHAGETRTDILTSYVFTDEDLRTRFRFAAFIVWASPTTGEILQSSTIKTGGFSVIP